MPRDNKKSARSSKTDRVLGLLTDPVPDENSAENKSPEKVNPIDGDRASQAQIRQALEEALEGEMPPSRRPIPGPEPDSVPFEPLPVSPVRRESVPLSREDLTEAPSAEPAPAPTPTPAPAAGFTAAPASAPAPSRAPAPEPAYTREPAPEPDSSSQQDQYFCYNIAQSLVEAKVDQFIKSTGMCTCQRCRIDVVALALSNLPPKYVVTKGDDLIPRLSIYETRFSADITAQVLSACRKVARQPHHNRS